MLACHGCRVLKVTLKDMIEEDLIQDLHGPKTGPKVVVDLSCKSNAPLHTNTRIN